MDDQTKITFLGLSNQETAVITSMFRLWSTISPLNYRIVEPSSPEDATLVFMNGDNPDTMSQCHLLREKNSHATPVIVGNQTDAHDYISLPRPLIMRQVLEVLQNVLGTSRFLFQKTAYGVKAGQ